MVSWFHRFRGVNGFMVSWVSWCQWFHGFIGFMVSQVSWCQWFHGFMGFLVSMVSWFHRFRGVSGFMVSQVSWCPGYNYTESSFSHQCMRLLSCHLICSNCFYLQQIFFVFTAIIFYLQQLLFICSKFICFAETFLFAACPLWATVLNRGKRKSFGGKLHL